MKFILLNIIESKTNINKKEYEILDGKILNELELSKSFLNKIATINFNKKQSLIEKIQLLLYESKFKRMLVKKDERNQNVFYLLPQDTNITDKHITYLRSLLEKNNIKKATMLSEMENNFQNYINEYVTENKLNENELKILFVYKNIRNVDLSLILKSINKYKKSNIYLKDNPSKELLNNIEKINEKEGCIIETIKYNKKAFIDYDVIYYVDDYRSNYPRMRLNKNALIIDMETALTDKFNSNIIFFNKINNKPRQVYYLKERYGLLPLAYVLRQV